MPDTETPLVYTAEQLATAQALVDEDRRQKAAASAAKHQAYLAAARGLIRMPEWAAVRDTLVSIAANNEADDLLSVHVIALRDFALRLERNVPEPIAVATEEGAQGSGA